MTQIIRAEALTALDHGAPLSFDELLGKCPSVVSNKQLSNVIFQLKESGLVVSPEKGLYQRAGNQAGGTKTAEPGDFKIKAPPYSTSELKTISERSPFAGARGRTDARTKSAPEPTVEQILQRLIDETQGGLDEYLYSVGDRAILQPLMDARDSARKAMAAYREAAR